LEGLAKEDVGLFYGHLVYFVVIWYIFPRFGISYQEKSGNPVLETIGFGHFIEQWLKAYLHETLDVQRHVTPPLVWIDPFYCRTTR
jgi:hypothetical protein